MNEGNITRHCAFCHIALAPGNVRKCGKCLRRAYCGEDCEKKDSESTLKSSASSFDEFVYSPAAMEGQGHKEWCGVQVCEEDLDWYRKKGGKGVVAKRLIRKGERILVGHFFPVKMFNHSCDANSVMNDETKVTIITALKDIEPGSEITYNYAGYNVAVRTRRLRTTGEQKIVTSNIESFDKSRNYLKSMYGITCPRDCICYNKEIEKIVQKRIRIQECLENIGQTKSPTPLLTMLLTSVIDALSDFDDKIPGNPVAKAQMISNFLKALRKPENQEKAHLIPKYEKEAKDIFKSVFPPTSKYSTLEGW